MNKHLSRLTTMILAFTLTLGAFTPGQAKPESAGLMSNGVINLAYFYKPPLSNDPGPVAAYFDFVILSGKDEPYRNQLLARGFDNTILQYFGSVGIQNPGSCTATPRMNQVAYLPGDFCRISNNHPDWFLLDARGRRILTSPGSDTYRMDPGNPGWQAFFVRRVLAYQAQRVWTGLFLDNLEASLSFIQRDGHTLARYRTDAAYQAAQRSFLEYLRNNYAQPYNRPVVANIIARRDEASWFAYMPYLDGAMQERWGVEWGTDAYLSVERWKSDLALAERTQSQGKHIILVSQGRQADTNRQAFAFASYLLVSNGQAAFRYSHESSYHQVWLYDNYRVQLGAPRGPRYQTGNLWRRDFANGYVVVDPVNHTATISTNTSPATPVPTQIPTQVVQPTATAVGSSAGPGTYDDRNSLFSYSPGWQHISDERAYQGSLSLAEVDGALVRLPFNGQSFSIIYKGGVNLHVLDVYVDGVFVATLNQNLPAPTFQKRWDYPGSFAPGQHMLNLVFKASGADVSRGSLDAVIVR